MLRWILTATLGVVLLLLAAVFGAWFALDPPELEVAPARSLVLRDVTVVNPGLDRSPRRDVRIEAGEISSVAASTGAGGEFAGYFALPGLIDSHVHLSRQGLLE